MAVCNTRSGKKTQELGVKASVWKSSTKADSNRMAQQYE